MLQQPTYPIQNVTDSFNNSTLFNSTVEILPSTYFKNAVSGANGVTTKQMTFRDDFNNFTFTLTRKNDTVFISPLETNGLTELKIGVLLPFHQHDNAWTKMITLSGVSALRMAVAEINTMGLIPGAYITLVERDSYPKEVDGQAAITQAVYSTIALMHEGVIAVIGDISSSWTALSALLTTTVQIPQCSFSAAATSLSDKSQFGYFFRTIPTDLMYTDAVLAFVASQGWPTIGILFSGDNFGKQLSKDILMKAHNHNIVVKGYQPFFDHGSTSNLQTSIDRLMATGARVIFVAAIDDSPLAALIVAGQKNYINNDTVWLTIGVNSDLLHQSVNKFNNILSLRTQGNGTNIDKMINDGKNSSSSAELDHVVYAAKTSQNLTLIQHNSTFSGGIFSFESMVSLPGYAPFDNFLQKWASLDPGLYPYGGQRNISGNEGYAYSCMMNLAEGFNSILKNSTNIASTLHQLAYGQLGPELSTSTFNTSYFGPSGPIILDQNGDMAVGNYRIYNMQNGVNVEIANIIAGDLNLISLPIYHDGTTHVPTGVPPKIYLNPGYSTPLSIILVTVSAIGSLIAVVCICLVLVYRKQKIFKASSPLFCILVLAGFLLCYMSAFFFAGDRSRLTCILFPVAFNLGYSLIMVNFIAKNYRIYRVFNNVFITQTVVADKELLKVSGGVFLLEIFLLLLWLFLCEPQTLINPVSRNAYYITCSYNGPSHPIFVAILTLVATTELIFAVFLSVKTQSVGKNYEEYSEYKHIGISVYNIFFSAMIGGMVFFLPTTGFYTQHYLTASLIVWATTFSLLTIFLPKLLQLRKSVRKTNKITDYPKRHRQRQRPSHLSTNNSFGGTRSDSKFSGTTYQQQQQQEQTFGELLSMNGVLNADRTRQNSCHTNYHHQQQKVQPQQTQHHQTHYYMQHREIYCRKYSRTYPPTSKSSKSHSKQKGLVLDAYEGLVPMQLVLKYIPWLSSWDMKQVVLMPNVSYFGYFSENKAKGEVFGYSHASVSCASNDTFILKVHGSRFYDILIQLANQHDLIQWCEWFNSKASRQEQRQKSNHHNNQSTTFDERNQKTADHRPPQKSTTLDSGITTRHLLAGEDDDDYYEDDERRRGSSFTLATLGSEGMLSSVYPLQHLDGNDNAIIPPLPFDPSMKPPWVTVGTNFDNAPTRHPSSYFAGTFTTSPIDATTDFNTPDSDIRTMVGSPTTNDDDIIMMHDL